MKVTELFEASAYYKPAYDAKKGWLRGSVDDWMKEMKVSKEDIAEALKKVKQSSVFTKDIPAAGLEYVPMPASEKNGTLTFQVDRDWGGAFKYKGRYKVYANGQIRAAKSRNFGDSGDTTTPLKSPKPHLKQGDPVQSVVNMMTAAMKEMITKWKKSQSNSANKK